MTKATMKFVSPETHLVRDHGPFQLRRIHPGVALGRTDDAGFGGLGFGLFTLVVVPPLALFTRYYLERRAAAWHDVRTFFVLLSQRRLKAGLLAEGQSLTAEVEGLVKELAPRLS